MNNLLEISMPLLHLIVKFRKGKPDYFGFSEQVYKEFDNFIDKASQLDLPYQDACYALAAWVDEIAMFNDWPGRIAWMAQPLQIRFFSEHLAGEGFYTRLHYLRNALHASIDTLEIYYLCLQLGFMGTYRLQDPGILQGLLASLYQQIMLIRGNKELILSNQIAAPHHKSYWHWPRRWFLGLLASILVISYGSAQWLIIEHCQSLLNPLTQGII